MKSKSTALIFLHFLFLSCKSPHYNNSAKTDSATIAGVIIFTDTMQPAHTVQAGKPVRIRVPELSRRLHKPTLPNAHFVHYNTEQGLALSSVSAVYCDKTGQLWLGTDGGGVSKYDGHSFSNYTSAQGLANNTVRSIVQDKTGTMWFGTEGGGLSKYDGRTFTVFNSAQGLASDIVRSILEDADGNLWFGTYDGGVSKYDGKTVTNFSTKQGLGHNSVSAILQDRHGNIWFGTEGGGLSKYRGNRFVNYTSAQGLAGNTVKSLLEDKQGNIWIGTEDSGISKYDGHTFVNFNTRHGLTGNTVLSIAQDKTGLLWFGTQDGGVSRYDGSSFYNFTTDQGLSNNAVLSMTLDKTGGLWLGTQGGGVSHYVGPAFSYYPNARCAAKHTIYSLIEDSGGNIWLGTYNGGVVRYDGKGFTRYTTDHGLANNTVFCMAGDSAGNLWFGTYGGGLSKYDGKSFTNFTTAQGLSNNNVLSLFFDRTGTLWIGTYGGGVNVFNGHSFKHLTARQGLAGDEVVCITQDKNGCMWFGTQSNGLSKYDGKFFTNYTMEQGLSSNSIFCLTEDKNGNFWIGTENGLCRLTEGDLPSTVSAPGTTLNHGGGTTKVRIKTYTGFNGLPDNFITQVVELPNGKTAVGTNVGFAAFNPNLPMTLNDQLPQLEIFNSTSGYPIKDINAGQNCMYLDRAGLLWIATGDETAGLVRFDYKALRYNFKKPMVVIQRLKLNEQPVCYDDLVPGRDSALLAQQELLSYKKVIGPNERDSVRRKYRGISFDSVTPFDPLPSRLILPYKHNNVTFEYNCPELSRHFMVNYQYLLEGYDEDWSPVLKKHEATYGNIYEGTYTFKLRAQSPEGVWSEISAYTFTVLPPWWRTWWMYLVYALLGITFVSLIVWWNGRKLKARALKLAEEVKKATKEIVEQKKVVEEKHKEITDSINYAERIQRSLLASKELLDTHLNDYFILFKPKDVVSGDFYWATPLPNRQLILVTADSTGHGVPGAIMSILNISCLEKAVEVGKLSTPDKILNYTRKKIIETLKRDGSPEGGKDGMDGSLLSFNFRKNQLLCASANNPVWVIRPAQSPNTVPKLIELKGDKMPVGKHEKDAIPFTLHHLTLQTGDLVYTLTDGYADQFGGERGKKFTTKRLRELLLSIAHEPMARQKQTLNEVFDRWKGNLEQVDDVCLIGVKV